MADMWTGLTDCSFSGNTLTGAYDYTWSGAYADAGHSGVSRFTFKLDETNSYVDLGLTDDWTSTAADIVEHEWRTNGSATAEIYELGTYKADTAFAADDRLEIRVDASDEVTYWKNGSLVYTSLTSKPSGAIRPRVAFMSGSGAGGGVDGNLTAATWEGGATTQTRLDVDGSTGAWWDVPNGDYFDILTTEDFHFEIKMNAEWSGPTTSEYICGRLSCWYFLLHFNGLFQFVINSGPTAFSSAISETDWTDLWIKVTVDVDNGAGNAVIKFYKSTDERDNWTLISTHDVANTDGITDNTQELQLGAYGSTAEMTGKIYNFEHRVGIGGAITFAADFDNRIAGATEIYDFEYTDATITQNGAGAVIEAYSSPGGGTRNPFAGPFSFRSPLG